MTINVCIGSNCHLKGSYNIIHALQELIEESHVSDKVEVKAVFCLGNCQNPVSVKIDDQEQVYSLSAKTVKAFFEDTVLPQLA